MASASVAPRSSGSRIRLAICAVGALAVLAAAGTARGQTLSVRAVQVNGDPIEATNLVTVSPGDQITAELFLFAWGGRLPEGVASFNMVIPVNGLNFVSGSVRPPNWSADECTDPSCTLDEDCLGDQICCNGCCVAATPVSAFIDASRPDYLFFGRDGVTTPIRPCGDARYFGAVSGDEAVQDDGVPRYIGTLLLNVSEDACGLFSYSAQNYGGVSYVRGGGDEPYPVWVGSQRLAVLIEGCSPQLIDCWPENCSIDSSIPFNPWNPTRPPFPFRALLTFNMSAAFMGFDLFEVSQVPALDGVPPARISSITINGPTVATILNMQPRPRQWTCVRYLPTGQQCCAGVLPGDVDANRRTEYTDLEILLDELSGASDPPLPLERCDIDESRLCAPADLALLVDLLAGVPPFVSFDGASLPECPSE